MDVTKVQDNQSSLSKKNGELVTKVVSISYLFCIFTTYTFHTFKHLKYLGSSEFQDVWCNKQGFCFGEEGWRASIQNGTEDIHCDLSLKYNLFALFRFQVKLEEEDTDLTKKITDLNAKIVIFVFHLFVSSSLDSYYQLFSK